LRDAAAASLEYHSHDMTSHAYSLVGNISSSESIACTRTSAFNVDLLPSNQIPKAMSVTLTPSDLRDLQKFTVSLARKAGKVILEGSEAIATRKVEEKKNSVDLVTEFDRKVEDLVKSEIKAAYPSWSL
jgi:hypothetical protein